MLFTTDKGAVVGLLINGKWHDKWYDTSESGGHFVRVDAAFRHWVTPDASSNFPAQAGRYILYTSLACPWAHRTLIFRKLKKLENVIDIAIVDPLMGDKGWQFSDGPGCIPDTVNGLDYLHQLYTQEKADYTGRVTVPVLFDKLTRRIVSNESAEIIEMLNSAFDAFGDASVNFFPPELRVKMDALDAVIYDNINNGVYKAGFATGRVAYEASFDALFATLDQLEARLLHRRFLHGERITASDWRLFTTLVRFDAVYYSHFKCNLRRVVDYPNLYAYLRELYQFPGIAETVNMDHIKTHYYASHPTINPSRIVPKGPLLDFEAPPNREHVGDQPGF